MLLKWHFNIKLIVGHELSCLYGIELHLTLEDCRKEIMEQLIFQKVHRSALKVCSSTAYPIMHWLAAINRLQYNYRWSISHNISVCNITLIKFDATEMKCEHWVKSVMCLTLDHSNWCCCLNVDIFRFWAIQIYSINPKIFGRW